MAFSLSQSDLVIQLGVTLMFHVCSFCVLSTQLLWFEISGNNFQRHTPMHSLISGQTTIYNQQFKIQMSGVKHHRILEINLAE